jgi:tRNA pseudouridine55 synthase
MSGVLVIDKPIGPTSHDIVMMVKRILRARKVGHIGTLDPIASGVLPLCINDATRLARFLEDGEKEYLAVIKLGEETDTYDSTGNVVAKCDTASLDKEDIAAVIDSFKGKIKQMPPMFSAVKMNGIALYKLARLGVEVERRPRDVEIYSICVNDITIPFVTVNVICSKGTYIRSLAFDIGRKLGCGAHIVSLRRIKSGQFSLKESITLGNLKTFQEDIAEKNIISMERIFADIYDIEVDTTSAGRIMDGIAPLPTLLAGKAAKPSSAALSKGIDFSSSIRDDEMVSFTSGGKIIALARYKGRDGFKLERVFNNKQ